MSGRYEFMNSFFAFTKTIAHSGSVHDTQTRVVASGGHQERIDETH
jgi:hypothetical protein